MSERWAAKPRDRIIGSRLRAIRLERTSLSMEAAAGLLKWSLTTQSRIENGQRHITTEEVASILTAYGIPVSERDDIVNSARSGDAAGWWDKPLPGVPKEMGTLASYAVDATSLTDWSVSLVPGMLQTEEYAVAVMLTTGIPPDVADLRWVARKRRQQLAGTLDYAAYIYSPALYIPLGGREAHRKQLNKLLGARDRGITVRIVEHPLANGVVGHSWLYMTYPYGSPVVNVEVLDGGVYLHDAETEPYTRRLQQLERLALSATASQARLRSILKEV